jgi:hypothetical protein
VLRRSPLRSLASAFSIAVLPGTQNRIDDRHQKAQGFPIDASELFLTQMLALPEFRARFGVPH